ncbi:MAG: hypothetical protein WKF77_15225 [Planctomycetaceae bacterium]
MKGSIVYVDKKIVFRNEQDRLCCLLRMRVSTRNLVASNSLTAAIAWHGRIRSRMLYLRDQDKLLVYNLK